MSGKSGSVHLRMVIVWIPKDYKIGV